MDLADLRTAGQAIYYGICVAAVLRGDRPLRYIGTLMVLGGVISPLAQWGHVRGQPYYGVMVVDVILLGVMTTILIRYRRWWLVVATGFFFMSVLTHFAALVGPDISTFVTSTVRLLWNYAKVLALGCGLVAYELQRRRGGREDVIRALIAEQGEARTRAEIDRRCLVASTPSERAEAARLSETLRQLTGRERDRVA